MATMDELAALEPLSKEDRLALRAMTRSRQFQQWLGEQYRAVDGMKTELVGRKLWLPEEVAAAMQLQGKITQTLVLLDILQQIGVDEEREANGRAQ